MKSNVVIFGILTTYFLLIASIYTVWNIVIHGRPEWAGSIAIFLSGGLTAFIAVFLWIQRSKQGGEIEGDRLDADIDDGDPEMGEFSPWSWWPIFLALAIAAVVLGMCIGGGFWLTLLSLPLVIIGVVGWIYEYYRGNFAR